MSATVSSGLSKYFNVRSAFRPSQLYPNSLSVWRLISPVNWLWLPKLYRWTSVGNYISVGLFSCPQWKLILLISHSFVLVCLFVLLYRCDPQVSRFHRLTILVYIGLMFHCHLMELFGPSFPLLFLFLPSIYPIIVWKRISCLFRSRNRSS